MKRRWMSLLRLVVALALCLGVGIAGSTFTASEIPTWCAGLHALMSGLAIIVLLLITIGAAMLAALKIDRVAAFCSRHI